MGVTVTRDHLAAAIVGHNAHLSRRPKTLAPDALLELGGFGASVEAEQLALCCPAERYTADPQDLAAGEISGLSAINNRGDNIWS
jgi:hypothetical protein